MQKAISGFFRSRAEGATALKELLANGFSDNQVSYLAGDTAGHETPAVGPVAEAGGDSEAAKTTWIGGAAGLAAGLIAVAIPPLGPLLALGPLAGAIGGMGVGAAVGGVIGLLKDYGISEDEAKFYAQGVAQGGSLVTVHNVDDNKASETRKILDRNGAIKVEDLAA